MYNLDSTINRSLDRFKIKDWCLKNLSPSEFWQYLSLTDTDLEAFEEDIWSQMMEGYEEPWRWNEDEILRITNDESLESLLDPSDTWPTSELEWEEISGKTHYGPGLAAVNRVCLCPFHIRNGEKEYSEILSFWSERGFPWVARNYFSHYDLTEWNEMNDSLVRTVKERRKSIENYNQLLLGISLA